MKRRFDILFLVCIAVAFVALAVVFCFFPRSTFSQVENRELKEFPEFSVDRLKDGSFTKDVSEWFSDSEPFRDEFMVRNMEFKKKLALKLGPADEEVTFVASSGAGSADPGASADMEGDERNIGEVESIGADAAAKVAEAGIIIAGSGPKARALMVFGGSGSGKSSYADALNTYRDRLPSGVNVYAMVIPTSIEFYCPEKVKKNTRSELATIKNIYSQLSSGVKAVDVYTPLGHHAAEDIYLRTDHHWAPLGAYYAAEKFAKVAGVPFAPLSSYNRKVVHDFVGTMYGYSKDISIKKAPEDFIYYTPKDSTYVTNVIEYELDKDFRIIREYPAKKSRFFYHFKDGSSAAYSTFMGGDRKIVNVSTNVKNGRRLLIIKDSFGNALPGYFFSSFNQVHVVDFRYFTRNLKKYIADNKITDVVIALNVFNAYSSGVSKKLVALLDGRATSGSHSVSSNTSSSAPNSPSKEKEAQSKEMQTSAREKQTQSKDKQTSGKEKTTPQTPETPHVPDQGKNTTPESPADPTPED